jgi:hypothetical protein
VRIYRIGGAARDRSAGIGVRASTAWLVKVAKERTSGFPRSERWFVAGYSDPEGAVDAVRKYCHAENGHTIIAHRTLVGTEVESCDLNILEVKPTARSPRQPAINVEQTDLLGRPDAAAAKLSRRLP